MEQEVDDHTYTLHRCKYIVSRGDAKGLRCYRPMRAGSHRHWVGSKVLPGPECHRRWPDRVCMLCGDGQDVPG